MRNKSIRFITEVGIFSAIGIILDILAGFISPAIWPQGGSVSITLVPILMMGYRWGLKGGLMTGLVVGSLQIIWAPGHYLIHPIQVLLDYPLAYGVIGLSGFVTKIITKTSKSIAITIISLSTLCVGLLRTLSHIVSGVYYWGTTWEGSIIYNFGYMIPSIFITILVLTVIFLKAPQLIIAIPNQADVA